MKKFVLLLAVVFTSGSMAHGADYKEWWEQYLDYQKEMTLLSLQSALNNPQTVSPWNTYPDAVGTSWGTATANTTITTQIGTSTANMPASVTDSTASTANMPAYIPSDFYIELGFPEVEVELDTFDPDYDVQMWKLWIGTQYPTP